MLRWASLLCLLLLAGCGGASRVGVPGTPIALECAPYARAATGIALFGDAADWWDEAEGRYQRASAPIPGSVLVFQRSARLPHGHVSVVRAQLSDREILVDHANWVHGTLTTAEPVVDVSPGNDWSEVQVWWAPAGQMGVSVYPVYGFLSP